MNNNHKNVAGWHWHDYYQWMLEQIDGHIEPFYNYSLLLNELHSMEFTWAINKDENRAIDGINLRKIYIDEENLSDSYFDPGIPCSVLEMLIGLSIRCDREIMGQSNVNEAGKWFWIMIDNLDLMVCRDEYFNASYVRQQIGKWLNRNFDRSGIGSPFPLHKKRCSDQRNVEIWKQMCGYLTENYL